MRKRIKKCDDGRKEYVMIPRYRCTNSQCRRIHTVLPDILIPHKHFEAKVIQDTIESNINDVESTVSTKTIYNWKKWFSLNVQNMEGMVRSVLSEIESIGNDLLSSTSSILEFLKSKSENWLSTALRIIYNAGHFLSSHPAPAFTTVTETADVSSYQEELHDRCERNKLEKRGSPEENGNCNETERFST